MRHEQCLYEFENDVGYDSDSGKVASKYYCPNHHPRKDALLSDNEKDNDEDDDEDEVKHLSPVTDANLQSLPTKSPSLTSHSSPPIPPLPPLPGMKGSKRSHECDWRLSATGCVLPTESTINCQREECKRHVHHLCAIEWEQSKGIEQASISAYCRYHHFQYPSMNQLQLVPTGGDLSSSSSSSSDDDDNIDNNISMDEGMEVMLDEIEEEPEKEKETESVHMEKDEDVSVCSADSADSGDDGSEAELHNAGTEFEPIEREYN